jgi:hypothetical protein
MSAAENIAQLATMRATGTEPWPELDRSLASDDRAPSPPFNWDAVPPVWRTWLNETAETSGAPVDYVFSALLAIGSAALGNARRVMPRGGWIEPPHLWFALVGNPSSGKTPALAPFIEAAKEIERTEEPAHRDALAFNARDVEAAKAADETWKSEVKEAVKNRRLPPDRPPAAMAPEAPPSPRLLLADATTEVICRILAGNPKGLALVRDELAGLIGGFDRYSGSGADRGFYLEAWNGGRHIVDRVKLGDKPLSIPFASLAIVGGIQPDRLAEVLRGADDGLAARFLFVWPAPVRPSRTTGSGWQERADFLRDALARLRALALEVAPNGELRPLLVRLDAGALEVLHTIRDEVFEANRHDRGLMAGWRGKAAGRLLRIGLVLEFLGWAATTSAQPPESVSQTAISQAAVYLAYCEAMMGRVLGDLAIDAETRDAATVARWIARRRQTSINGRSLSKETGLSRLRDTNTRRRAFDRLEEAGWIRPVPVEPGRGRKPDAWQVNPALWET